jgi:hypothetical protein
MRNDFRYTIATTHALMILNSDITGLGSAIGQLSIEPEISLNEKKYFPTL